MSDWKIARINIPPGRTSTVLDMMGEDQGIPMESNLGRWFVREMQAFNGQTRAFSGLSEDLLPFVTLGPDQFYLFPDCAFSEGALVPFRLVAQAESWNALHPSGEPVVLGLYWHHKKIISFREEQGTLEKSLSINIGVHEAGHALQHLLEVTNPGAEAALRNACVIACQKAMLGQGLGRLLPRVMLTYMNSDPNYETIPHVYQTVHSLDPRLAGRIAAADSDFWEAYQVIERLGS